jgi:DNA recombination protein RmuC
VISWAIVLLAFVLGGVIVYFWRQSTVAKLEQRVKDSEERLGEERASRQNMSDAFRGIALDALTQANQQLAEKAGAAIDHKKALIDKDYKAMSDGLDKMAKLMGEIEKDRERKFGELSAHLSSSNEQTQKLLQTTNSLKEALANSRARGQWGERMAEDVLRLAGFVENIQYTKQKAIEGAGSRPDFTFNLPKNLSLNMDVKFPFDNYVKFLNASSEADRDSARSAFFRDIKAKLKEVTGRDYINPTQNTVDYVILLVPNEQVFSFIQENDPDVFDSALKSKVVCVSPITLFAVLAVIRQAVDNFSLEQTSNEILSLLGNFKLQWSKFLQSLEKIGKKLDDTQKEYESAMGTRKSQLEKPLNKIDSLRAQKGIAPAEEGRIIELPEETYRADDSPEIHSRLSSD